MTEPTTCNLLTIQVTDEFDLEKTAESGQCFRWNRTPDGGYRIIHAGGCLTIRQTGAGQSDAGQSDAGQTGAAEYCLDCGGEEYRTVWKPYFDLDEDYRLIRSRIDPRQDSFLYHAAEEQRGIRILRQDPWETLISFIISQNKNIPAIHKSIELLAQSAGKRLRDGQGGFYYAFPTPEEVFRLDESALKACKVGYRWKYIRAAARAVLDGTVDFSSLAEAGEAETIQKLTGIYGVGNKVANCVSLFGLHHTDAFPMDVWVKRILANEYPGGYPFARYSPYNGIYQQYMFASYRNRFRQGSEKHSRS